MRCGVMSVVFWFLLAAGSAVATHHEPCVQVYPRDRTALARSNCRYWSASGQKLCVPLRACEDSESWRECHAHINYEEMCIEARKWEREVRKLARFSPCARAFGAPLQTASTCTGLRDLLACNGTRVAVEAFASVLFDPYFKHGALDSCPEHKADLHDKLDMVDAYVAANLLSGNFFVVLTILFQAFFVSYLLILPHVA